MKPELVTAAFGTANHSNSVPARTNTPFVAPSSDFGPMGQDALSRHNVYWNHVAVSSIDLLATMYLAVWWTTEAKFFRAMARFHVRATARTAALLFDHGCDLPHFIESYESAQDMPWLADSAQVESEWLESDRATDLRALSVELLNAFVARFNQEESVASSLPAACAALLLILIAGETLGVSVAAAFEEAPSFRLSANLTEMIAMGVFITFQIES
jgi:hypothetical protein